MNIRYKNGIGYKDGKYYGKIKVHGVQRQFLCHGAKNESQARAILDAERYKLRLELAGLIKSEKTSIISIDYLFNRLIKYGNEVGKKTVSKDIYHAKVITKYFKNLKLNDISLIKQKHILDLQLFLKNTPMENGKFRENSTVNRYIASLRAAFNILIKDEDIPIYHNPCVGVPDLLEDNRRSTYLPKRFHEEFINLFPEQQTRDIVILALNTGLRMGNIFKAHRSQFDLEAGYWIIEKKHNKGKKYIKIKLNSKALGVIKKYYYETEDYLFKNPTTNRPVTTIRKSFKTAAEKIGIPDLQPKDLRRTVGTILYQSGKSLRVVKDVLHHTNVSTTERYLGITPEELDDAYNSLEL